MHLSHENKRKVLAAKEVVDCYTNSPCQHFRECIESSMENAHTDVGV